MVARTLNSSKVKKIVFLVICAIVIYSFASYLRAINHRDKFTGVMLTGTHHMGPNFNITDFYVNGYSGSNVGREGGGGSNVCCVSLPKEWRPGLVVDLRWNVGNWTKEVRSEIEQQDYRSLSFQSYRASVPVERYQTAEHLYVHFFPGGRARVVSSTTGVGGDAHPISDDPREAIIATTGIPVPDMFSDSELAKKRAEREAEEEKSGGAWK